MEIWYQGSNITDLVEVSGCIVRDTSADRCDSLEIEFENAAGWAQWGPQEDDVVIVTHDGYDSGMMYVNTVVPEDTRYKIYATSLPCKARTKEYRSFSGKTVEEIVRTCAGTTGMKYGIYGDFGSYIIPYIQRENESCAAFLNRLAMLENAVLKCVNGKYVLIGLEYANAAPVALTLDVSEGKRGVSYHNSGQTIRQLTVKTPYAEASANDYASDEKNPAIVVNCLPAMNNGQAKRWAVGKLTHCNRACESLRVDAGFIPSLTAMVRVNVTGGVNTAGAWLAEEVTHDLVNLKTTAVLRRCIQTIR